MDNRGDDLAPKLSGSALNGPENKDRLFQVIKAVEAAEVMFRQQVSASQFNFVSFFFCINDCTVCNFYEFECLRRCFFELQS